MMPIDGTLQHTMRIASATLTGNLSRTYDGAVHQAPTLPAGIAGTLTTRTDDNTGIVTVDPGHGVTASDYVDVYWAGGIRYGMDVTAVTSTTISVDLGAGDVLPAQDSAVVVGVRQTLDVDFDGDEVGMMGMQLGTTTRANVEFTENDDTSIYVKELAEGELWYFVTGLGMTNELAGDPVGKIKVSNGTTTEGTFTFAALYNSVS